MTSPEEMKGLGMQMQGQHLPNLSNMPNVNLNNNVNVSGVNPVPHSMQSPFG